VFRAFRGLTSAAIKKPRREYRRGFEKRALWLFSECSVAHAGRPAEAGMMVPVVVRDAEHFQ
jgi:hypothetical protein